MKSLAWLTLAVTGFATSMACSNAPTSSNDDGGTHTGGSAGTGTGGASAGTTNAGTTGAGTTSAGTTSGGTANQAGSGTSGGQGGSGGVATGGGGAGGLSGGGTTNHGGAGSGGGGMSGGGGGSGGMPPASAMSPGCGKTPTLTSGKRSITSGGQSRSFIMRIPDTYDKSMPHRLIFGYHWVGGTAEDVDGGGTSGFTWSYYGLREQAANSTIFVAPQGISNGWGNGNNSDVIFTDDMIKLIEGDLCVDTTRVFAMGFSYGGGMTKALGCQRPSVFRAIAVYSGADFLSGGCDATSTMPIAYIGLHSVSDGTNPFTSGETIRDRFVKNDGCTAQTPPKPQGLTHVCTKYEGCKAGYPVEWCAFDGGGHTPAPVDGSTSGSGGGDKTWTKAEVWKFFTQF